MTLGKRFRIVGFILVVVVAAGALTYFMTRPPATSNRSLSFRLKWLFLSNYAESFVASSRGYWSQRGLDVSLHPGGFENDSITMVAGGSDHFGITGADDLIIARTRGVPIVAIAAIYQDTPVAFMVRADSSIRGPADFRGRRVGVKYGTNVDTQYRIMLQEAGVDPSSIEEVAVRFDLSPFVSGAVDVYPGYAMGQPEDLRHQGLDIRVIQARDHGIEAYGNVLFTTEARIEEDPDLVQAFVGGYLDGFAYALEHPEEAVQATLEFNERLERDVQTAVFQATVPFWRPNNEARIGDMIRDKWLSTQDVLVDGNAIEAPVDINGCFTTKFVDAYYAGSD